MAIDFAMGLKPILVKILSIDGVAVSPADSLTSIGQVLEGSTTVNQDPPAETEYFGDYDDTVLYTQAKQGAFVLETDIVEVTSATVSRLTGAVVTPAEGATGAIVSLPTSAPTIIAEVEIPFDNGFEKIRIHEAQLICNYNGQNIKTEMFKLHLKAKAIKTDDGDYVDIVYPSGTAGVVGAVNTYSFVGGTGYEEDDILTLVQAGGAHATFLVTSVDGSGVILTMSKLTSGTGYTVANTLATTDNSVAGANATISVLSVL